MKDFIRLVLLVVTVGIMINVRASELPYNGAELCQANEGNGFVGVLRKKPGTTILSYLSGNDIAMLNRSCKALRFVWDNDAIIRLKGLAKLPALLTFLNKEPHHPVALDLGGYCLEALPEEIKALTQLRELDLYGNFLQPQALRSLCCFTHLLELNLGRNCLYTLPEEIKALTQLQRLDLWGNYFNKQQQKRICRLLKQSAPQIKITF